MRFKNVLIGLFVVACLLTGCNTLFRGTPETIQGHTNIVVSVQPDGSLVTNVISQPTVTVTNWVKGEAFDTIGSFGGIVPVYGEVAVAMIGLVGTIYLSWLNRKHKGVAVSTIQTIGQFRAALQGVGEKGVGLDETLKTMLKDGHERAGVKVIADKMVKAHTSQTNQPEAIEEMRKLL